MLASLTRQSVGAARWRSAWSCCWPAWRCYRLRGRFRKDSGETSFLESRLQPDSFFGASGGQRVDTRDAASACRRR